MCRKFNFVLVLSMKTWKKPPSNETLEKLQKCSVLPKSARSAYPVKKLHNFFNVSHYLVQIFVAASSNAGDARGHCCIVVKACRRCKSRLEPNIYGCNRRLRRRRPPRRRRKPPSPARPRGRPPWWRPCPSKTSAPCSRTVGCFQLTCVRAVWTSSPAASWRRSATPRTPTRRSKRASKGGQSKAPEGRSSWRHSPIRSLAEVLQSTYHSRENQLI